MMSFDKKWAVILISSTLLSAINTSPSILPLGHADVHHHPAQHLPVTYDHEPHPIHPASPAHGKDHHHEKHPLPLSHDPYKHDHHHYKDPYHHIPQYYHFGYQVNTLDGYGQNDYHGHTEQADAYTKKGEYKVKLPDGRLQVISYIADEYGFRPKITYEPADPPVHHNHPPVHSANLVHPSQPVHHDYPSVHPGHPVTYDSPVDLDHRVHPIQNDYSIHHELPPVKKPHHLPIQPRGTYKLPIENTYVHPKPLPKVHALSYPTRAPTNYVTPDPTIVLPLAGYEPVPTLTPSITHQLTPSMHHQQRMIHNDLDLSYLPPTIHSSPSTNVVYKALPIRRVHQSSSVEMIHKGTPIKNYLQPKVVKKDPPRPLYVTPKPASYVTPLPKQLSLSYHRPTATPKPAIVYSTTPRVVSMYTALPHHNSIERQDLAPSIEDMSFAPSKQHYYLVTYNDPEDSQPKLFLLAKKN